MTDHTLLLAIFLPMLGGMAALFIGLAIYSRRQAKAKAEQNAHEQPATSATQNSKNGNQSSASLHSELSKSGAVIIEAGTGKTKFADVAGCDEAKEELKEVVDYLQNPELFKGLGVRMPKGLLLIGPPGNGKTLLAKAVAGEANATFISMSGSQFVEMYVGIGAARVRDLFKEARNKKPAIVFIDEIDAIGRKRSSGAYSSNDEREASLNQLLIELDGFVETEGLVVIAATNRVDILDPALIRSGRFDRQILVDLPTREGREAIFAIHTKGKPLAPTVSLAELSRLTPGFSGADIEGSCNEAATVAARRLLRHPSFATMTDIERRRLGQIGIADFAEGIDRVQMGVARTKRAKALTPKQIYNTSVHEIGHAWIADELQEGYNVAKITVLPRSQAMGYTMILPDEDPVGYSEEQLKAQIATLLAGRIAQEVILGVADTGASDDFKRATRLAFEMVTSYGMSPLGTTAALSSGSMDNSETALAISESLKCSIEGQVRTIIEACRQKVKEIIERDKEAIIKASKILAEKETILSQQWKALKQE